MRAHTDVSVWSAVKCVIETDSYGHTSFTFYDADDRKVSEVCAYSHEANGAKHVPILLVNNGRRTE